MTASRTVVLSVTVGLSLRFLDGLPTTLAERGCDVHVLCSPGDALDRFAVDQPVSVHAIPMRRRPNPARDVVALAHWIRLLRRLRPEVAMVGTPKAGLLGMLAARLTRVPRRVYVLHGLRLETERGVARLLLTSLERLAAWCATDVIAVSESIRKRAIALTIVPATKIRVLGGGSANGIDLEVFDRTAFPSERVTAVNDRIGLRSGVPVVGFMGRIVRFKGVLDLAVAVRRLRDEGRDIQLLAVGAPEGEDGRAVLAELIEQVPDAVLPGFVAHPEECYAVMTALCLPSLREGFPVSTLEAAAMRVPVVAAAAPGTEAAVIDGVTGLLVPPGDPMLLAGALRRLLDDPATAVTMGEAGGARVRREFARERVVAAIADHLLAAPDAPFDPIEIVRDAHA